VGSSRITLCRTRTPSSAAPTSGCTASVGLTTYAPTTGSGSASGGEAILRSVTHTGRLSPRRRTRRTSASTRRSSAARSFARRPARNAASRASLRLLTRTTESGWRSVGYAGLVTDDGMPSIRKALPRSPLTESRTSPCASRLNTPARGAVGSSSPRRTIAGRATRRAARGGALSWSSVSDSATPRWRPGSVAASARSAACSSTDQTASSERRWRSVPGSARPGTATAPSSPSRDFAARAIADGLAGHWSCWYVVTGRRPPWWR
jgi:hypothetical protein